MQGLKCYVAGHSQYVLPLVHHLRKISKLTLSFFLPIRLNLRGGHQTGIHGIQLYVRIF